MQGQRAGLDSIKPLASGTNLVTFSSNVQVYVCPAGINGGVSQTYCKSYGVQPDGTVTAAVPGGRVNQAAAAGLRSWVRSMVTGPLLWTPTGTRTLAPGGALTLVPTAAKSVRRGSPVTTRLG